MHQRRRVTDRRAGERNLSSPTQPRKGSWDDQRTQYITRYLFAVLGLAYFNLGEPVARTAEYLLAINVVHVLYFLLVTAYLIHAFRHTVSPTRLRLAMWTDLIAVTTAVMADASVMSPAYLVYLVIVLGNGMRYGLGAFGEAVIGGLVMGLVVLSLRFTDYWQSLSVISIFFLLFVAIIVLYSYALMRNIERARQELEAATCKDELTGLLNRRGLQERSDPLFHALARNRRPVAILFADVDGFKAVNDAHGHDTGDRVLRQVATHIANSVRGADIAARYGGDEFIVIMPDTAIEQAALVAKRLQAGLSSAIPAPDIAVSLTIGMAQAPEHGNDLTAVLKRVDAAMYQGKLASTRGGIQRADGVLVS